MPIKLIIGLRNPGLTYAETRHNVGGWFVSKLAEAYQVTFKAEKKFQGELANIQTDSLSCKLFLPLLYMNESGRSIRALVQFYQIKPEEILIAHDDLDLDAGRIKLKTCGGHGGHNGLRDVISYLNSTNFNRVRIGIGHPGHKELVVNYVLSKPNKADKEKILEAIARAINVMPVAIEDMQLAMNNLNG